VWPPSVKPQRCLIVASRLLFAGGGWWTVYDEKPRRFAEDSRTYNLVVRSGKCETEVINNKRLCSRYCTQSIAQPLCNSRASCYVHVYAFVSRWLQHKITRNLANSNRSHICISLYMSRQAKKCPSVCLSFCPAMHSPQNVNVNVDL